MPLFLLLLFLIPSINAESHYEEAKSQFWKTALPYDLLIDSWNGRPNKKHIGEMPDVFSSLRDALLEQDDRLASMMRDAGKPSDEKVQVEMILLAEDEKFRTWHPMWVRKVEKPETARLRIFLNQPADGEIAHFCETNGMETGHFKQLVAFDIYFAEPILICSWGTPAGGTLDKLHFIMLGVAVFFWGFMYVVSIASLSIDAATRAAATADPIGEYHDMLVARAERYATRDRLRQERQGSADDIFRGFREPKGPNEDPFPIDPFQKRDGSHGWIINKWSDIDME